MIVGTARSSPIAPSDATAASRTRASSAVDASEMSVSTTASGDSTRVLRTPTPPLPPPRVGVTQRRDEIDIVVSGGDLARPAANTHIRVVERGDQIVRGEFAEPFEGADRRGRTEASGAVSPSRATVMSPV